MYMCVRVRVRVRVRACEREREGEGERERARVRERVLKRKITLRGMKDEEEGDEGVGLKQLFSLSFIELIC